MSKLSLFILLAICPLIINSSDKQEKKENYTKEQEEWLEELKAIYESGDFSKFLATDNFSEDKQQFCKKYLEDNHKEVFENIRKSNDKEFAKSNSCSTVISPDGKYVISNAKTQEGEVYFSVVNTKTEEETIFYSQGDQSVCGDLAISHDSKWLFSVCLIQDTAIYSVPFDDFDSNKIQKIDIQHLSYAKLSTSGNYMIVSYLHHFDTQNFKRDYRVGLYDVNSNKIQKTFKESSTPANLSSNDKIFVYHKTNPAQWMQDKKYKICVVNLEDSKEIELELQGNLLDLNISKCNNKLLVCTQKNVLLYNLNQLGEKPIEIFHTLTGDMKFACFGPDDQNIIFYDHHQFYVCKLSDLKTKSMSGSEQEADKLLSYDISSDGSYLIARIPYCILIYDLNKSTLIEKKWLTTQEYQELYKLKYSSNGKSVLASSNNIYTPEQYKLFDVSKICPLRFTLPQTLFIAAANKLDINPDDNCFKIIKSFKNHEIEFGICLKYLLKKYLKPHLINDLTNMVLLYAISEIS